MAKNWTIDHESTESVTHRCQVKTNEDWYPTINSELTLSVIKYDHGNDRKLNRICIWGGDDYGFDCDFEDITFTEMKDIAEEIPEPVTVEWLKENGFIHG